MTIQELKNKVEEVEGVDVEFARVDNQLMLRLWRKNSPIAHVYADENEYNKDYIKLYEMNLYDMFEIDQALYDFTQTPIEERELNVL